MFLSKTVPADQQPARAELVSSASLGCAGVAFVALAILWHFLGLLALLLPP